jgi:hypothetical protein
MALTFFKTPKNKQFNYRPVYWDKKKEERDKRLKSALEASGDNKDYAEALRERMELRWKRSTGARARKNSNLRLIMVLAVIGFVFYYLFLR